MKGNSPFACRAYLYGNVKTHKPGFPIRPIISTVGSVSYSLSKFLVKLLQPLVGTIANSNVLNSVDLVNKLRNVNIEDGDCMVSFDVTSLFTNVPVDDVLNFLTTELDCYVFSLPTPVIVQLIRLCVVDTCFIFNGRYYKQKRGMQMGNCLSPILANIYMEYYETRLASAILPENTLWLRYVDDIFCKWKSSYDLNATLQHLNNLVPSIKFTIELEENDSIAFLDVKIIKENHRLKFSIHRKMTSNNLIIHSKSFHHKQTKQSALRSMFLRALQVVSPQFLDDEINNIYEIGFKHGFNFFETDECLSLAKKTFYSTCKYNHATKYDICLPYHPCFESIIYPLKLLGFSLSFSYPATIGNVMIRNSPLYDEGTVYMIPCQCRRFYIGQTSKSLKKRIATQVFSCY